MKFLRISLALVIVLAFAAAASAAPSLLSVQKNIYKAAQIWEKDQAKAQQMLKSSFAQAIAYTQPKFIEPLREKGFYLAVSCYSPELQNETMLAADTYLKSFPKGRYAGKVNLFKAIAAFDNNDKDGAVAAIDKARNAMRKSLSYPEQTMIMDGYISAGHHRSAEEFIEGQKISKPSSRLTKDLRKFHRGNRKVESLLNKVRAGEISGLYAVDAMEKELQGSYFAKKAPEMALNVIQLKDRQKLAFNPVGLEWCGLERAVKHSSSPQLREKKYLDFLSSFPQAAPGETYYALQNLRNIYLYEMRDEGLAQKMLFEMKKIPGFADRAEIEEAFTAFTPEKIITLEGYDFLRKLLDAKNLLPYDNGALPILERDYVTYLMMISEMALGRVSRLKTTQEYKGWGGLPVALYYSAASESKEKAWEIYSREKSTLNPQIVKMFEDVVMPLYLPAETGERLFLAGLATVEKLPTLGTTLLIKAVSDDPRMFRVEHGLAVLADVYNRHLAYREAQHVWNILSRINPDSIWLK